jgi:translation elongation factor P/translation initiation factor 5A
MKRSAVKTKDPVRAEEREVERLVRPAPKIKPPRADRAREIVREHDPDLDEKDPDLSLNYKDIGGKAVKANTPTPFKIEPPSAERDTFRVHDQDGKPYYFMTKLKAEEWLAQKIKMQDQAEKAKTLEELEADVLADEKAKTPLKVLVPTSLRKEFLVFDAKGKSKTFETLEEAEDFVRFESFKMETDKKKQPFKINKKEREEKRLEWTPETDETLVKLKHKISATTPEILAWAKDPSKINPASIDAHFAELSASDLIQAKGQLARLNQYLMFEEGADSIPLSKDEAARVVNVVEAAIAKAQKAQGDAPVLNEETIEDAIEIAKNHGVASLIPSVKKLSSDAVSDVRDAVDRYYLETGDDTAKDLRDVLEIRLCQESSESTISADIALKTLYKERVVNPSEFDLGDDEDRGEFMQSLSQLSDRDLIEKFQKIPIYALIMGVDDQTQPESHFLRPDQKDRLLLKLEQDIRRRAFFNDLQLRAGNPDKLSELIHRTRENSLKDREKKVFEERVPKGESFFDFLMKLLKQPSMKWKRRAMRKSSSLKIAHLYMLGVPKNTRQIRLQDVLALLSLALAWYDRDQMSLQSEASRRRMALDYAIHTYGGGEYQRAVDDPFYVTLWDALCAFLDENA